MSVRSERFDYLQCGRALAAISVMLHHTSMATGDFVGAMPQWFVRSVEAHGFLGVDFFFVLSGFIILHAHRNDPMGVSAAASYFRKRLTRIFVPYLPISVALIALYLAFPNLSGTDRGWGYLTSLTLLPSTKPPALSVAWTLVHEMMFYSLFLLSFFLSTARLLAIAWAGSILAMSYLGQTVSLPPVLNTFFNPLNLEFLFDALVAITWRHVPHRLIWPLIGLGCCGALIYFAFSSVSRVWFGLTVAVLVLGLVRLESVTRIAAPRFLVTLGAASYALYLIHNPLISALVRVIAISSDYWLISLIVCSTACILTALLYHLLFEVPTLQLLTRRRSQALPGTAGL